MLYQCLTRYKGSDNSEISLNKGDVVKVLDKKDHGEYTIPYWMLLLDNVG